MYTWNFCLLKVRYQSLKLETSKMNKRAHWELQHSSSIVLHFCVNNSFSTFSRVQPSEQICSSQNNDDFQLRFEVIIQPLKRHCCCKCRPANFLLSNNLTVICFVSTQVLRPLKNNLMSLFLNLGLVHLTVSRGSPPCILLLLRPALKPLGFPWKLWSIFKLGINDL